MKKYNTSIFIFRRDYRLNDNRGLMEALKKSMKVIPIFILTPEQLDDKKNDYKSDNAVQFMVESLEDLDEQLKSNGSRLFYFYGTPDKVIEKMLKNDKSIDAVYVNMDYSPYSIERDKKIKKICEHIKRSHKKDDIKDDIKDDDKKKDGDIEDTVEFISVHDGLLNEIGSIKTGSNQYYSKFTPFYNAAKKRKVMEPESNTMRNYIGKGVKINGEYKGKLNKFYKKNDELWRDGGRKEGLKIIKDLSKFKKYNKDRNDLNIETTCLSAYIKFGCVSIREVYYAFKNKLGTTNDLIKQLYWRDFYHNILYAFPHVVGGAMRKKYNDIRWNNDRTKFKKWCEGKTGFPVVDAAMRSMNETGFMHNRGRLIVSNFLIKIMLIDWRWGEKYFSQKLMDIDIANNNGNWQWGASTGADSQPYFRIFNPWLQSEKFDSQTNYIKKWIPELKDVPPKHIHQWYKYYKEYPKINYPEPIVDYETGKKEAIKAYKRVV